MVIKTNRAVDSSAHSCGPWFESRAHHHLHFFNFYWCILNCISFWNKTSLRQNHLNGTNGKLFKLVNYCQLLDYYVTPHSYVKTVVVTCWALLETFWLLFTPICGHTAGKPVTPLYPKSSVLSFDHRLGPNILKCVFWSPGLKKRSVDNFFIFLLNKQSNKM